MANTLKFGNGNWATKEDSVLAYNDENNNFKPLPFDFTRASTATYVDSDGLIKTSRNGEARIDYTDSTDGALILEPQRINLITQSEAFDNAYWIKSNASVTSGFISPDGTSNAFKLVEDTSNANHRIYQGTSNTSSTLSFYAKADGRTWVSVLSILGGFSYFDIGNGVLGTIESSSVGTIEAVGNNGWYRCTLYNGHSTNGAYIGLSYANNISEYQGDGTSGVYIFGAQLEQGSYATSYIPTSGSTVTRVADACSGAGNEQVINSSEGVLFADIAALDSNLTSKPITINDTTSNNELGFYYYGNRVDVYVRVGGLNQFYVIRSIADATITSKIALKYKENDFALWINGIKVATDTSGNVPTGLSELAFKNAGGTTFYGKTKDLRVYNTALTDAELATLTT